MLFTYIGFLLVKRFNENEKVAKAALKAKNKMFFNAPLRYFITAYLNLTVAARNSWIYWAMLSYPLIVGAIFIFRFAMLVQKKE